MKKILMLFVLLSCMVVYGEETVIDKSTDIQNQTINNKDTINWGPYMKELEDSIKNNWTPTKNANFKKVVTRFAILKDGTLSDIKIIKSSEIPSIDNAAIEAIKKTSPYKPLPELFERESLPIEYTFNYNVYSQTYNNPSSYTSGTCKTKLCKFIYEHQ